MQPGGEVSRLALKGVWPFATHVYMSERRPDEAEVRVAVRLALEHGVKRIEDVAGSLHLSKSTLQRRLAQCGTTFTVVRRETQLSIALECLIEGGSARKAARRALLSPDHLCVMVRQMTGLTPRRIARAAELGRRVEHLRTLDPPESGTWLYRRRLRTWERIDGELDRLLGDLGPDHPLADWAKRLLLSAQKPDFRRQPYRERIRAKRQRESERLEEIWREFDDRFGAALSGVGR